MSLPINARIQWVEKDGRLTNYAVDIMTRIIDTKIDSEPPDGKQKITNMYWDDSTGELNIEWDDGSDVVT